VRFFLSVFFDFSILHFSSRPKLVVIVQRKATVGHCARH
jgi:hypothetical protein